ncbi:von Willebrand factor type A domain-containing protein [Flavobacterium sp. 103]|uniref:vWA domain-containing protein n=1 Tax=Flavobacterium sp. 103 TaxID=2135624 RepID=UPI000D5DABE1|nr:vWA domain-containing protein [Flavobacterium sp. 103]PVX45709.1 von Willebrand factor type A domain-containing protein [Flavobacterium sp. 103]
MKTTLFISALLATTISFASCNSSNAKPIKNIGTEKPTENTKIQVALLLDTSNSMDGLIDQAKSRLWNIVNTLTTLKYSGKTPDIEIALYEYGNDGLAQQSNYIRQVTPLTTDLDLISEKLFALKTNGGNEYCGAVIQDATKKLQWKKENSNMKLIYIAGNEAFNQGGINYKEAISDALKNDIYVNTIFCGSSMEGINTFWKDGADYGKGKYFNIDSNLSVQYVSTPYDDQISKCNVKINNTYIGYGAKGSSKKMNQEAQDKNAQGVSSANYAERAVSKSKAVYKNESWDLVDRVKEDPKAIAKIKKEELPAELQNKSEAEVEVIVTQKAKEREIIQKEIGELAKKRQQYIDAETKKTKSQDDLGNAINTSIVALAKAKGYTVER